jgi:hypothetical protein
MLRSHLKSHTKGVPYQCNDCTYSSKYHTSLKTHLEKFNHKEATVSTMENSPPLILDTTPRPSSSSSSLSSSSSIKPNIQLKNDNDYNYLSNKTTINDNLQNEKFVSAALSNALPYATYFPYLAAAAALVATNHQQQYNQMDDSVIAAATVATLLTNLTTQQANLQQQEQQSSMFIDDNNNNNNNNNRNHATKTLHTCDQCKFKTSNKRDLKIHKRDEHSINHKSEPKLKTPQKQQTLSGNSQQTVPLNEVNTIINNQENTNLKSTLSFMHECNYCNILFKDLNLFSLHQQFHGDSPQDAFKCTKCGIKLNNKYDFNLHIVKQSHLNDINICNT